MSDTHQAPGVPQPYPAEKARQGSLTPEEQDEIEDYERVGHLLGMLQSKARLSLSHRASMN